MIYQMKTEIIMSAQNPKIKMLLELQEKSKTRRREGLFVVEGLRELEHCIATGYEVHTAFICKENRDLTKSCMFWKTQVLTEADNAALWRFPDTFIRR